MGCGREAVKEDKSLQEEEKKAKEKVVLWTYFEVDEQKAGLELLLENFNNSQDKYEASWEYKGPLTEFTKQLSIGVAEEELPDMVLIDPPDMRTYVDLGLFEDITDYVNSNYGKDEFYPAVLNSVRYDERYYGIPFSCNNVGLIYNKLLLQEAGVKPPGNWEEFQEVAAALTKAGTYGFAMSAIANEQSAFQVLPWILSTGETMETLGGEGTVKALSMLQSMVEQGYMSKDCINWSQVDVTRKFIAEECAMMENGPWSLSMLEEAGMDYGIIKLPVDVTSVLITGGENMCLIKGKNIEGGLALMDYYYNSDSMLSLAEKMCHLPPQRDMAKQLKERNEVYQVFEEQMEHCISRSDYPYWSKITGRLSDAIYGVITGSMSAQDAASRIEEAIP